MKLSEDDLVRAVEDPASSAKEREEAATELLERCRKDESLRERYLMRMITFLADDAPAIRGLGILGVLLCDEELENLPRLVRLLDDPSPGVRLQAVHALAPLGIPALDGSIASKLDDEDRMVRVAAAAALALLGDVRSTPVLLEAVGARRTRFEALYSLRYLVDRDLERREAIERVARSVFTGFFTGRFDRLAAASVLAAIGDERGRRYLLDRADKGRLDRPLAIELIGELKLDGGEELLVRIAGAREDPFRGAALRGLGSFGSGAALITCRGVLQDEAEDADLRCDAAEGLLLLGGEDAKGELLGAQERVQNEQVRSVIGVCLSLFGKPSDEVRLYLPLSGEEVVSP